eukprot:gene9326-60841_t
MHWVRHFVRFLTDSFSAGGRSLEVKTALPIVAKICVWMLLVVLWLGLAVGRRRSPVVWFWWRAMIEKIDACSWSYVELFGSIGRAIDDWCASGYPILIGMCVQCMLSPHFQVFFV